ncbi:MAG: hypothetical protein ACTSU4_10945 [Promethearchaeota archaeon]
MNQCDIEQAFEYYKNVRKSLSGLFEILKINLQENDFYYQAGIDNLKAIQENMIKFLNEHYSPRQVRMKLREIEFDEQEMEEEILPF